MAKKKKSKTMKKVMKTVGKAAPWATGALGIGAAVAAVLADRTMRTRIRETVSEAVGFVQGKMSSKPKAADKKPIPSTIQPFEQPNGMASSAV